MIALDIIGVVAVSIIFLSLFITGMFRIMDWLSELRLFCYMHDRNVMHFLFTALHMLTVLTSLVIMAAVIVVATYFILTHTGVIHV